MNTAVHTYQDWSELVPSWDNVIFYAGKYSKYYPYSGRWFESREDAERIIWINDSTEWSEKALRYNDGKPDWSLVDFHSLLPMVRVLEYGAKKYTVWEVSGRENWKKPMDKKQILNSAMRHLIKLMEWIEQDEESWLPEVGHLMCNLMFYAYHSRVNH